MDIRGRGVRATLLAALLVLLAPLAPAAEEMARPAKGYDAFALVKTRNIFDPNRKAPRKESDQPRVVAPSRPRSVHLALTGTMVTEGRSLAFFTGSRSEFNKIIPVGEKVGDFTITAITAGQVELDQAGKPTTLAVGKRLQLEGTEADPAESETAPAAGAPSTSADPAPPGAPGAPTTGAPGSPAEILKRMMERRAQEMKK